MLGVEWIRDGKSMQGIWLTNLPRDRARLEDLLTCQKVFEMRNANQERRSSYRTQHHILRDGYSTNTLHSLQDTTY